VNGVVVGMSRPASTAAIRWASTEAAMRGLPLDLVHAWDEPLNLAVHLHPDALPGLHSEATAYAVQGSPATALLGRQPDLLALGRHPSARHLSRLTRMCLDQATCPVVIVPDGALPRTGRILVGVRYDETSRAALRWAAAEAQRRLAQLVVVHAWQPHPTSAKHLLQPSRAIPAQRDAVHDRLNTWTHTVLGDIDAELNATHDGPLDALLRLGANADLIVLGRGTHSSLHRILGSAIGNDLSNLAPCPIATIPSNSAPPSAPRPRQA
jgi:nucleotide-binding universal stress UspA family protein